MSQMKYRVAEDVCRDYARSSNLEWMLSDGCGGFAMGTVSGANLRRYHGHLVVPTNPWTRRMVLLANIEAYVQSNGDQHGLSTNQYVGAIYPSGYENTTFAEFDGWCKWAFAVEDIKVEKSLGIHPGTASCTIRYQNVGQTPIQLVLRPLVCHKFYHANFTESPTYPSRVDFPKDQSVVTHDGLSLTLTHPAAQRLPVQGWYYRFDYTREVERGLDPRDDLYCPCELRYELLPGEMATIVASARGQTTPLVFEQASTDANLIDKLKQTAEKFVVQGGDRSTVVAGYPWFTDWGRDTMISLPGLCLATNKTHIAKEIISGFAAQMRDGLIPNRFVESGEAPEYNTVDGTLWFVNATYLALNQEWDQQFAESMMAAFRQVFEFHMRGTRYGIRVEAIDGLLTQGQEGVQLTWMDAKVGDWVVTPRHGKPVEVNGLWINALRCMEGLAAKLQQDTTQYREAAVKAESNFDLTFWKESLGHYLDTADPDDGSLRPNQVIAMSLPFAPAKGDRALRALDRVTSDLFTPKGLRTLSPHDPNYRGRYEGAMPQRDAAYHQGTAWPWLLGPYLSAIVKLKGDKELAKQILSQCEPMLTECGIGGIAEIYDGDEPQRPSGCPWQAWSVAELLRVSLELQDV